MAPVDRRHGVDVFEGFPVGALVFWEPAGNAEFNLHAPVAERVRNVRAPREAEPAARPVKPGPTSAPAAGEEDSAKDNALFDAFSQAIAAAMHAS